MLKVCHWIFLASLFLCSTAMVEKCRNEGATRFVGSSPSPILASVGSDVILPCYMYRSTEVKLSTQLTVEWSKPSLKHNILIYVSRDLHKIGDQNTDYTNRTDVFSEALMEGNFSLKLWGLKLSDEGMYRCFIPSLKSPERERCQMEAFVQLNVCIPPGGQTKTEVPSAGIKSSTPCIVIYIGLAILLLVSFG